MSYSPMELADVFIQTGEFQDALEALDQQLSDHPADAEARRLRAAVLLRINAPDSATRAIADLEAITPPTAADHVQRAIIHEQQNDLTQAIAAMRQAVAMEPTNARYAEMLLQLLVDDQQFDEALQWVRQQARDWRWLQWEGDLLAQQGDDMMATARYGLALALLDEVRESKGVASGNAFMNAIKGRLLVARADAYRRLQQIDLAIEHYEKAQRVLPDDPIVDFYLGLFKALAGDLPTAVELCQQAIDYAPDTLRKAMQAELMSDKQYDVLANQLTF